MFMLSPDNQVRRAIRKIGGPTKAACLLNVSGSCIHRWIANGYIPNIDHARKLATESGVSSDLLRRVAWCSVQPSYRPSSLHLCNPMISVQVTFPPRMYIPAIATRS